jgi:hypothetical protein
MVMHQRASQQRREAVLRHRAAHPKAAQEAAKRWRANNLEADKEAKRRWYIANRERLLEAKRQYWVATGKELQRRYLARRYQEDPIFRITCILRTRLYKALKGNCKSAKTMELIGCTPEVALFHIESTWREGWNWDNYGVLWEVDHEIPCAKFDLSDPTQQRKCFHWTNLRAYPVFDNRSEGARR